MNTPDIPATIVDAPRPGDFENIIALLAVLGEANRQLRVLESDIEHRYLHIVDQHRERYAKLQTTVSETEAALEVIARRNKQWFADRKSVATPYGTVKSKSSKELVVANEEASVVLILAAKRRELVRRSVVLNKEALQELTDEELARFGIVRKAKENITIDTDVIDLGKAVKSAEKSAKAAAKTAKQATALAAGEAS